MMAARRCERVSLLSPPPTLFLFSLSLLLLLHILTRVSVTPTSALLPSDVFFPFLPKPFFLASPAAYTTNVSLSLLLFFPPLSPPTPSRAS